MNDEKQEHIFPDGISFDLPHNNAPEWVKGKIMIKPNKLMAWAEQHLSERGWLFLDLKKSKKGTYYLELNTWKPSKSEPSLLDDPENSPF